MLINLLGVSQSTSILFPFLIHFILICFHIFLFFIFKTNCSKQPQVQFASCHAATDLRLNCFLLPTLLSPSLSSPLSLCLSSLALTCWCCCCGCCCGCSKANGANSCPYSLLLLLLLLALFRLLANTSNAPRPPTSELASETGAAEPRL